MVNRSLIRTVLTQLPTQEDDYFEFKSSATELKELKKKLSCAVSGFANSGGGCFIAGVDADGNADNDIAISSLLPQPSWTETINLEVKYYDLAGNSYEYKTIIESSKSILPISFKKDDYKEIVDMLRSINNTLTKFSKK